MWRCPDVNFFFVSRRRIRRSSRTPSPPSRKSEVTTSKKLSSKVAAVLDRSTSKFDEEANFEPDYEGDSN